MTCLKNNLIWIDLEMTGLDPLKNKIIEIATIITDSELNILAEGPVLAIHQSEDEITSMDDWCTNTHTNSGLITRVRTSKLSEAQAEAQTLSFLKKWALEGVSPMCGNSIGQDRRFLEQHMPALVTFFHYRNLDVSTIKELVKRWKPEIFSGFNKKNIHLALEDIRESIQELRYYREHVFKI